MMRRIRLKRTVSVARGRRYGLILRSVAAFSCLALLAAGALAATRPGSLDRSFGSGGITTLGFGAEPGRSGVWAMVRQPDGKLVVLANVNFAGYVIGRFNADGTPDPTFGGDGFAFGDFRSVHVFRGWAGAIALQPDGKVVVGGSREPAVDADPQIALARYNPDGTLDRSFGDQGLVSTEISRDSPDIVTGLAVQPDGRLIAAGTTTGTLTGYEFARYDPDGDLDPTFGDGGTTRVDVDGAPPCCISATPLLIHGAGITLGAQVAGKIGLVRLDSDGRLDSAFGGGDGIAVGNGEAAASDLAIQADGKLLVTGGYGLNAWRFLPDGAVDQTFGDGGRAQTGIGASTSGDSKAIAVQGDGRIVVAGSLQDSPGGYPTSDFAAARFDADGSLDPAFGGDGVVRTDIGGGTDQGRVIALAGERVIVAGEANSTPRESIGLVAYRPDGSLDGGFGNGGIVNRQPLVPGKDFVSDIALQSDRKLVVVGRAAGRFGVARYLPSGRLDPSFADGAGFVETDVPGTPFEDKAEAVALQADGGILVAGLSAGRAVVLRYDEAGGLDGSFGDHGIVSFDGLDYASAVEETRNHEILVAGFGDSGASVARLTHEGTLDSSWGGGDGIATALHIPGAIKFPIVIATVRRDRVLVGGAWSLVRLTPSGLPDHSFGENGNLDLNRTNGRLIVRALLPLPDGRVVLGGGRKRAFAMSRFNANGTLDRSFGSDGVVVSHIGDESRIKDIARQRDGRIVAVGLSSPIKSKFCGDCAPRRLAVARYTAAGRLDRGFGRHGVVVKQRGQDAGLNAVVLSGGGIVAGGFASIGDERDQFLLARFLAR